MIVSVLVNGLWQGAPIIAVASLLSRAVSQRNAATRYALWFATLLALVLVPLLTTASNAGALLLDALRTHPAGTTTTVSLLPIGPFVRHADAWFERLTGWILCAWLAGVGINLVRLGGSYFRIARIRRNARPLEGADPDVFVSEEVVVPIVAGIVAPAIVIPSALPGELTPIDLQRIIQHERAHVRRNDPFSNLVQRLIEASLFFNPWVRLAAGRLSGEREAACDDWVVEKTGSPDEYAACLAALAQIARPPEAPLLTPSAFGSRHALVSRIERLSSLEPHHLTVNAYAVGGTVVIFILMTLVLQAFSPALALTPALQGDTQGGAPAPAVAAACAQPNADARVVTPVEPALPSGLTAHGMVNVVVTIAPNGRAIKESVLHSSGNAAIDAAVLDAARHSTYAPKIVNCNPVQGSYVFHVEFAPKS